MDLSVLRDTINLIQDLKRQYDRVKENKQKCRQLGTHIEALEPTIQALIQNNVQRTPGMRRGLDALKGALEEAKDLILRAGNMTKFIKFIRASSVRDEFYAVTSKVTQSMHVLQLALAERQMTRTEQIADMLKSAKIGFDKVDYQLDLERHELKYHQDMERTMEQIYNGRISHNEGKKRLSQILEKAVGKVENEEELQILCSEVAGGIYTAVHKKDDLEKFYLEQIMAVIESQDVQPKPAEVPMPPQFLCPLGHCVMVEPVVVAETGVSYEEAAISHHFAAGNRTCPETGIRLRSTDTVKNNTLKLLIEYWEQTYGPFSSPAQTNASPSYVPSNLPSSSGAPSNLGGQTPRITGQGPSVHVLPPVPSIGNTHEQPPREQRRQELRKLLEHAIEFRNIDELAIAWSQGIGIDTAIFWRGVTPLMKAAQLGFTDIVTALIGWDAYVDARDKDGETALLKAACAGHHDTVERLLQEGANMEYADRSGKTAFIYASQGGYLSIVKLLHENGANVHVREKSGWTVLIAASYNGQTEVASLLIDYKVDVESKDDGDWTALHVAARKNHRETAQLLLERGADIKAVTLDNQSTALHLAAEKGHKKTMGLLLRKGADHTSQDADGNTALHLAAERGHMAAVTLLLNEGASRTITNHDGKRPEDIASLSNVKRYIRQYRQ